MKLDSGTDSMADPVSSVHKRRPVADTFLSDEPPRPLPGGLSVLLSMQINQKITKRKARFTLHEAEHGILWAFF